ncbi:Microtubule-associated protein 70-4 [Bienertia sinuspersici]
MVGIEDVSLSFISQPQPDPLVLELNHLQNQLKDKDNELSAAQNEIKASRATQAHKEKALDELKANYDKLEEKLRATENVLQQKNLEMKKLADEKKDALAAQFCC